MGKLPILRLSAASLGFGGFQETGRYADRDCLRVLAKGRIANGALDAGYGLGGVS